MNNFDDVDPDFIDDGDDDLDDGIECRVCGCTNAQACAGGCFWVEPDLCSQCAMDEDAA